MPVSRCVCGCNRPIYVSGIPGGGAPVGTPNASSYAAAALQCHGCGEYVCKPCAAKAPGLSPMGSTCPSCGGKLAFPGVEPAGGFPLAGLAAAGVPGRPGARPAARRAPAGPPRITNPAATLSLVLGVVGVACCLGSLSPVGGCIGMLVDCATIGVGAFALLKARNTGVGMTTSIIGLALGVINLIVTLIGTIAGVARLYLG